MTICVADYTRIATSNRNRFRCSASPLWGNARVPRPPALPGFAGGYISNGQVIETVERNIAFRSAILLRESNVNRIRLCRVGKRIVRDQHCSGTFASGSFAQHRESGRLGRPSTRFCCRNWSMRIPGHPGPAGTYQKVEINTVICLQNVLDIELHPANIARDRELPFSSMAGLADGRYSADVLLRLRPPAGYRPI